MEVWKQIEGFEGLYEVSNLGSVKSLGKGKSTNPNMNVERILTIKITTKIVTAIYTNSKYK